jgi:hypothetical protein
LAPATPAPACGARVLRVLASLGGPGPYIGGLIAILDLLVVLALFFGLRPDHLTDSSRPRKRRLIQVA